MPFVATFGLVLVAEIVGDKLLYTTGVLAARYASVPVVCGIVAAFMAKMGVAVVVGATISQLSPLVVAGFTGASFIGVAYALWRTPDDCSSSTRKSQPASRVALVSFATIFFSEWGDAGQITAATMAAQYRAPFSVWLGAVCAMATKGVLAASIGVGLRHWIRDRIPVKAVRFAATGAVLLFGAASVIETLVFHHQLRR